MKLLIENLLNSTWIKCLLSLLVGAVIASLLIFKYSDFAKKCEVVVLVREELLLLEKARVGADDKQPLFFGLMGEKLQIVIERIVAQYEGKRVKILYANYGGITGENVRSISKEVHGEIIKILEQDAKKQNEVVK